MADPSAKRQRRYRLHKKGDHSLCDEVRCEVRRGARSGDALREPVQIVPVGRGPRAEALWAELEGDSLPPLTRLLLEEVCRLADRMDRLDAQLAGRENWLQAVRMDDSPGEVVITVDNLVSEARQHATSLRGLISELRASMPKAPAGRSGTSSGKGGTLSDLSARIAARRGAPAG